MKEEQPDEEQAPPGAVSVRRAVLPWRRRIRNISRFDFTPFGGWKKLSDDAFGWIILLPLFPLWLPAAVVFLVAVAEFLLAALLVPVALVWRTARDRWPVELHDEAGHVLRRHHAASWDEAGRWAESARTEISQRQPNGMPN